jgi:hypothetical protein
VNIVYTSSATPGSLGSSLTSPSMHFFTQFLHLPKSGSELVFGDGAEDPQPAHYEGALGQREDRQL